jgi:hypothetical protein
MPRFCRYPAGMAEIVNLNRVRKAKARDAARQQAAANRAQHGRTRAERAEAEAARQRREALLDGQRLETPPPER